MKDLQRTDTIGGYQGIVTEPLDNIVDHRENGFIVVDNEIPGLAKVCRWAHSQLIYLIPFFRKARRCVLFQEIP
jgi:hypothetical protein